jgi:hypothetical protein
VLNLQKVKPTKKAIKEEIIDTEVSKTTRRIKKENPVPEEETVDSLILDFPSISRVLKKV